VSEQLFPLAKLIRTCNNL